METNLKPTPLVASRDFRLAGGGEIMVSFYPFNWLKSILQQFKEEKRWKTYLQLP